MSKKILIVDDEQETVDYLINILKRGEYDVASTTKGKEALLLAKSHKPDLIILDAVIPDMMGGEVKHLLSQDDSTKDIPIIFLSGLNTKEDEEIMREQSDNYHVLAKPVKTEELLGMISRILSDR